METKVIYVNNGGFVYGIKVNDKDYNDAWGYCLAHNMTDMFDHILKLWIGLEKVGVSK